MYICMYMYVRVYIYIYVRVCMLTDICVRVRSHVC